MYNTSKSAWFISPIMTFTSTPQPHIKRLGAAAQRTLVWMAVGMASHHIRSERVEKNRARFPLALVRKIAGWSTLGGGNPSARRAQGSANFA